jgi:hypothetical protein
MDLENPDAFITASDLENFALLKTTANARIVS